MCGEGRDGVRLGGEGDGLGEEKCGLGVGDGFWGGGYGMRSKFCCW